MATKNTRAAWNNRVLTIRSFETLPGYTRRVGSTMIFMGVEEAKQTIEELTTRGESWNTQACRDGVYISFDAQTFGATLDPKLTKNNLYWSAARKAKSLRREQDELENRLANYAACIAEAEELAVASADTVKVLEKEQEDDLNRKPWLIKDRLSAEFEERSFRDQKITPTLELREDIREWVKTRLAHSLVLAGTFREPTIRFMSEEDRARFTLKWGGKPIN